VRPDDRFVDTGEVVTSAGRVGGIDMALHLVVRLGSTEEATRRQGARSSTEPEPPV